MSAAAPVASAPACPFLIPTQLGRRAPIGLQAPGQTHRVHRLRVQHSALPCRLLRLHRPNSRIFLLSCAAGDAAASESLPGSSSPQVLLRNRHSYIINPQNFSPNVLCFHLWCTTLSFILLTTLSVFIFIEVIHNLHPDHLQSLHL
ncbi:uncharacterized protein LOC122042171 isoform X2 [Zingiber officinale]|uniref:uncharacterized protein LOC122042171 isoform X2 n=1 Tax=Zingiber officinale TaxID=94328 RepID=UPI001C4DA1D9|nr:uncharacterized protein LOC122042171 isoform X2 [Zingiber officinale]